MARLTDTPLYHDICHGALGKVIQVLDVKGEHSRVVGGAVRNALLGINYADVDLCTTLLPQQVMKLAKGAGVKVIPTGIDHGTVTLVMQGKPFEVTTLREDVQTDGRHAVVKFGRDFEKDAARRDFTINALSVGVDGLIHDYFGGVEDLRQGRVRFIGQAKQRIAEDYLRILRFFRFYSEYGVGAPDEVALQGCVLAKEGLGQLSKERLHQEFFKILVSKRARDVLPLLHATGILPLVIGAQGNVDAFSRLLDLEANGVDTLISHPFKAALRLAVLSLSKKADVAPLSVLLRLSREEMRVCEDCFVDSPFEISADEKALFKHRVYGGRSALFSAIWQVCQMDGLNCEQWAKSLVKVYACEVPDMPFSGETFLKQGLSGAQVGVALEQAKREWIESL